MNCIWAVFRIHAQLHTYFIINKVLFKYQSLIKNEIRRASSTAHDHLEIPYVISVKTSLAERTVPARRPKTKDTTTASIQRLWNKPLSQGEGNKVPVAPSSGLLGRTAERKSRRFAIAETTTAATIASTSRRKNNLLLITLPKATRKRIV